MGQRVEKVEKVEKAECARLRTDSKTMRITGRPEAPPESKAVVGSSRSIIHPT